MRRQLILLLILFTASLHASATGHTLRIGLTSAEVDLMKPLRKNLIAQGYRILGSKPGKTEFVLTIQNVKSAIVPGSVLIDLSQRINHFRFIYDGGNRPIQNPDRLQFMFHGAIPRWRLARILEFMQLHGAFIYDVHTVNRGYITVNLEKRDRAAFVSALKAQNYKNRKGENFFDLYFDLSGEESASYFLSDDERRGETTTVVVNLRDDQLLDRPARMTPYEQVMRVIPDDIEKTSLISYIPKEKVEWATLDVPDFGQVVITIEKKYGKLYRLLNYLRSYLDPMTVDLFYDDNFTEATGDHPHFFDAESGHMYEDKSHLRLALELRPNFVDDLEAQDTPEIQEVRTNAVKANGDQAEAVRIYALKHYRKKLIDDGFDVISTVSFPSEKGIARRYVIIRATPYEMQQWQLNKLLHQYRIFRFLDVGRVDREQEYEPDSFECDSLLKPTPKAQKLLQDLRKKD